MTVPGARPRRLAPRARRPAILLLGALALLAVASLARNRGDRRAEVVDFEGRTMGTSYRVRVDAALSGRERSAVADTIQARLDRVDRLMSTWDTASELSRLNRRAAGEPMPVSRDLIEVLSLAADVSTRAGGAFDVTVGALVEAWGFGPAAPPARAPDPALLARLLEGVGYNRLVVDPAAGTVTRTHPGTAVDLSAIAKGWGVEQVAGALAAMGHTRWLIEVGGELQAGAPRRDGTPWRVAVERPQAAGGPWGAVDLVDAAIATSGDTRDWVELDGERLAHIVDPRTGRPVRWVGASVSVVHARAASADAWATALAVLGPEDGWRLAVEQDLAALFLTTFGDGVEARATPAFRARVAFEPGAAAEPPGGRR